MSEYTFYIQKSGGTAKDEFTAETLPTFASPLPVTKETDMEVTSVPYFTESGGVYTLHGPVTTPIKMSKTDGGAEITISGSAILLATYQSLKAKEKSSDWYEFYDAFSTITYNVYVKKVTAAYVASLAMDYTIIMKVKE